MNQQEKFNKAWDLKKEGKFKEALDLYKELLNELIDEAGKYTRSLSGTRINTDDGRGVKIMPKLFSEVDKYLKRDVAYATILNNMGVIYAEAGDKKSAINCFKDSIKYTPDGFDYQNPKIGLKELE